MKNNPSNSVASNNLKGNICVPGDKSISHRSLLLASQAIGTSNITGLLEAEDVLSMANSLKKLGVNISKNEDGIWLVDGVGVGGLCQANDVLQLNNSGTAVRLLMGLVSSYNFVSFFNGDASLNARPMRRVIQPLQKNGANFVYTDDCKLPLAVIGASTAIPIEYELPVASAQVKSAILLAGLNCPGITTVIEPEPTRNHTELMLKDFGADITVKKNNDGSNIIKLSGYPELKSKNIEVPGDPSSAAFPIVAALITENSEITIKNICINPLRIGLFTTLIEMGANIEFLNKRYIAGEEVADIKASSSKLIGVKVPASRVPSMIDEFPILAIAAACAEGKTEMINLQELKVKESNRLNAIAMGLKSINVDFNLGDDDITVFKSQISGLKTIETFMDHRIAMSFLISGLVAKNPVSIDDNSMINTSFPNFISMMNNLGANIT